MKKSLIILVALVAFFSSCGERETVISSLEGTHWKQIADEFYKFTSYEIVFSSGQATITKNYSDGFKEFTSGTYTYNYPSVLISVDEFRFAGVVVEYPVPRNLQGTVKGEIITLTIAEGDNILVNMKFQKQ